MKRKKRIKILKGLHIGKRLIKWSKKREYYSSNRSPIFIIDEPELSLHISWQEIFVDALLKASPDTQFIMATHSPAILAKNERKQFCEDLTKSEWV